ncbi:hypothetical protein ACLX1H_003380 [Fusarium chlamydosporum]
MTPEISRRPHLVVPLYIYPTPGAWEPLFQAARKSPGVSFIVIINPFNGPGSESLPDQNYQIALSQLSTFTNVRLIGYVYCSYGKRETGDIQKDIATYLGWKQNPDLKMDGIFFDEVPSADGDISLMAGLASFTKLIWTRSTGKPGIVVHNPGVAVGEGFYRDVDLVVAFEQSENQWQNVPETLTHVRAKDVAIIHSCSGDAKSLACQIVEMGLGGVYLTEQSGGGYTHWPKSWFDVVEVIDQVSGTKR